MDFKNESSAELLGTLKEINRRLGQGGLTRLSEEQGLTESKKVISELERRGVIQAGYLFKRNQPHKELNLPQLDDDDEDSKTIGGDGDDIDILMAGVGSGSSSKIVRKVGGIINGPVRAKGMHAMYMDEAKPQVVIRDYEPFLYENKKYVRKSPRADRENILSSL